MGRKEIFYKPGTYEVTGFNSDMEISEEMVRLAGLKVKVDEHSGVKNSHPMPFQRCWLDMGTSHFSWWRIIGCNGDITGVESLMIERVDGPYAIICIN